MSDQEAFLETLKRIGFPEVHKYKSDDFVSMFTNKELKPILESFCSMTEDNVLSPEELAEYAAIPADELAYFEKLAQKEEAFLTDVCEDENREEVQFLEQHLSHIEEHNRILQRQKDLLKSHTSSLLEEKDKHEQALVDAKKKFETYTMQKLPQAQSELVSILQSISKLILELQNLITESNYDSEISFPNLKGAESYLDEERELLNYIQGVLSKNFQVEDFKNFILNVPGHEKSKLLREVNFLQKVVKNSKIAEIKAASEREKINKIIEFYKKCEDALPPRIFEISASELWTKLTEEKECHEKLIAQENLIDLYLSAAVAEHVDVQCNKIGVAHYTEVMQAYNCNLQKIQGPLQHVISQRSRLELVILYLDAYTRKFENIKQLTETASDFLEKEKNILSERRCHFEKELEKEKSKEDKYLSEDSVFLTIFKILRNENDHQNLSSVTMDDVFKKIETMHKQRDFLEKLQDKKLNVLNSLEKQRSVIERFLFQGKEFTDLSEMDMNFNTKLNKMGVTFSAMRKTVVDVQSYMDTKEKLLQKNQKLRLARCLFQYALCDEEKFHACIKNIKTSAENCIDPGPSQT